MQEIISQLEKEVNQLFSDKSSDHDIYHLKRTLNIALSLQEKEGGDRLIITVSALLHDVHRIIQKENNEFCSAKDSLPKVKEILDKTGLTADQKNKILHCVEFHEGFNSLGNGKEIHDIETLIVQDADNLDAIGAIGIGRNFAYGGANNVMMWIPEKPLDFNAFAQGEEDPSTIHHFYNYILKLKENMNTETAKAMAAERHQFMESFLERFFDEWNGKK